MGQVVEKVRVKNYTDIVRADDARQGTETVRGVEIDAIVDTGAAFMCLPPHVIRELGLSHVYDQPISTANGDTVRRIFGGAQIEVRDRTVQMQVMENDHQTPPLVGYLVLEALDFVVDPKGQTLIPNPRHGGKWIADCYSVLSAGQMPGGDQ